MKRIAFLVLAWMCSWGAFSQDLTRIEYYIDTDPGYGSGVDVPFVASATVDELTFEVSLTDVSDGFHTLFVRTKDENEHWSLVHGRPFYRFTPVGVTPDLARIEYYIDTDPGYGSGTSVAFTAGTVAEDVVFTIPLGSIGDGFHTLFVRSKNANDKWSLVQNRPFFKMSLTSLANIDAIEYFIDTDPGYGSGTSVSLTPATSIDDLLFQIDMTDVDQGPHTLFVRSHDANGKWSLVQMREFNLCNQQAPVANAATNVTNTSIDISWEAVPTITEYRFDVSADNFSTMVAGYANTLINTTSTSITSLVPGTDYQFRVRAVGGTCTSVNSNVIEASTVPVAPVAPVAVAASDVEETSFTANWSEVVNATSYRLDVSSDNFATFLGDYTDKEVNATSEDIMGLTGGATYQYRARGVNVAGTSGNSNTISVTTLVLAPAAPVATAATSIGGRSFTANWEAVYNADSYQLDVSADGFATYVTDYENKSVTGTSTLVTGLEHTTSYSFRVRSVNVTATSANSNEINVTTNSKDDQAITFDALTAVTYGDNDFPLSATSTSLLAISYSSSDETVATVTGNIVSIVGAGTSTLTASQSGDADYNAAEPVDQLLTVNKKTQMITFNGLPFKVITDVPFDLEATSDSGLEVTYVSSDPAVASISGKTVTITGLGTTTITASQTGNGNYEAANTVAQPLVVNKASQTITFNALTPKLLNDAPFNLTAVSDSQLPVSYTSSNPNVATIAGNTVTIVGVGTSTITASQPGDATYLSAADVQQTLTVNKLDQTITFGTLISRTFGDGPFDLTASSDSQLPVSYSSSDANVVTIAGATVTIAGGGTVTITASQAGNGDYNPATTIEQSLTINKANQSIVFDAITVKTLGDAPFTPPATASSTLAVTLTSSSDKVTITNNQVAIVKAGRATITANQPGNNNYNAANTIDQSFCINPAKPMIAVGGTNTESPTLTSSASAGNQWFKDGTAISGATNTSYSVSAAGVYRVQVTVDDCISEFSNDTPLIVTGVQSVQKSELMVYPNPASDYLEVRGVGGEIESTQLFDMTGKLTSLALEHEGDIYRGNVQHLSPGVYLLRLIEGKSLHQVKFIKR